MALDAATGDRWRLKGGVYLCSNASASATAATRGGPPGNLDAVARLPSRAGSAGQ